MADTTIRLTHIGTYAYGWEDAGSPRQRYAHFEYHLQRAERADSAAETPRT